MDIVWPVISQLLVGGPQVAVFLLGLGLAVMQLSTRRRAAMLAIGGIGLSLAMLVILSPLYTVGQLLLIQQGMPGLEWMFVGASVAFSLGHAVSWGLIIGAVFVPEAAEEAVEAEQEGT